jgi:hypothetical protein
MLEASNEPSVRRGRPSIEGFSSGLGISPIFTRLHHIRCTFYFGSGRSRGATLERPGHDMISVLA